MQNAEIVLSYLKIEWKKIVAQGLCFRQEGGLDMLKSIAVMTSGGDSPGMNAAVRAVTRTALHQGVKVWGIRGGYHGMLDEEIFEMESKDVGDIIQRG